VQRADPGPTPERGVHASVLDLPFATSGMTKV